MLSLIVLCGYATLTRGSPLLGRLSLPGCVLRGWRGGRIRLLRKVSLLGRSPLPHPQPLPGATQLEGGKLRATVPPTCGQPVGPAPGAARLYLCSRARGQPARGASGSNLGVRWTDPLLTERNRLEASDPPGSQESSLTAGPSSTQAALRCLANTDSRGMGGSPQDET